MGDKKYHLDRLNEDIAEWLPREKDIEQLLESAAVAAAKLDEDSSEVQRGLTLEKAETFEEVSQIAIPLKIKCGCNDSVNIFKKKASVGFQNLINKGTPENILELSKNLLNVEDSDIFLLEIQGEPKFRIKVPQSAINSEFGSTQEAIDIILKATAASYGLEVITTGTLEYISSEERSNNNYNSSYGYATLDSNGDITSGGTYSGYYNN